MKKKDYVNNLVTEMRIDPNIKNQVSNHLGIELPEVQQPENMPEVQQPSTTPDTTPDTAPVTTTETTPDTTTDTTTDPIQPQQEGEGRGLMTDEIDDIMKYDWYLGTVASDEINKLKPEKRKKYGFLMNLDKSSQPGSHWIAVWIDLIKDNSIEIYDPLALYKPTELFLHQMKQLIDKSKPSTYLLMKVNQVKNQSDTTDTCGWHSIRFLKERAKGNRFKFASGWTDLKEKEADELKTQNGYGFDTFI